MCIYLSPLLETRTLSRSTDLLRLFTDGLPERSNDFLVWYTVFIRFQPDGLNLISVCLYVRLKEIITAKYVNTMWMCT